MNVRVCISIYLSINLLPRRPNHVDRRRGAMWTGSLFCQCTLSLLCRMKIDLFLIKYSSWRLLGAALGPLQLLLGSSWDLLGRSGSVLGWSWVGLGPSWDLLEGSWEAPGAPWEAPGGTLGRSKIDQKIDPKIDPKSNRIRDGQSRSQPTFLDVFWPPKGVRNAPGLKSSRP